MVFAVHIGIILYRKFVTARDSFSPDRRRGLWIYIRFALFSLYSFVTLGCVFSRLHVHVAEHSTTTRLTVFTSSKTAASIVFQGSRKCEETGKLMVFLSSYREVDDGRRSVRSIRTFAEEAVQRVLSDVPEGEIRSDMFLFLSTT